eukprot:1827900-Rhodomonas_salina.1
MSRKQRNEEAKLAVLHRGCGWSLGIDVRAPHAVAVQPPQRRSRREGGGGRGGGGERVCVCGGEGWWDLGGDGG